MGLLDDAIREHLELKRRRGADPGEVAREQREALDSVVPEEAATSEGDFDSADVAIDGSGELAFAGGDAAEDPRERAAEPQQLGSDFSSVGQETAELDMQAVLDEDETRPETSASAGLVLADPARVISSAPLVEEESLEWEMPAETAGHPTAEVAYEERGISYGEHVELPRTAGERPELNADIPGQERLSFE
jgi:hypothetical protein